MKLSPVTLMAVLKYNGKLDKYKIADISEF